MKPSHWLQNLLSAWTNTKTKENNKNTNYNTFIVFLYWTAYSIFYYSTTEQQRNSIQFYKYKAVRKKRDLTQDVLA